MAGLLVVIGAGALLASDEDPHGVVTCSAPQVFTRSRLVSDRYREQQYLDGLLSTNVTLGIQGGVDNRSVTTFAAQASASIDPLARAEQNYLRNNLAAGDTNQIGSVTPPATLTNAPPVTAIDPSSLVMSPSSITELPTELLDGQMAYRDAVRRYSQKEQLDDTHDLKGATLYTLNFDIGIRPGNDVGNYLAVFISAEPDKDTRDSLKCDDWIKNYLTFTLQNKAELWSGRVNARTCDPLIARLIEKSAQKPLQQLQSFINCGAEGEKLSKMVKALSDQLDGLDDDSAEQLLGVRFPSLSTLAQGDPEILRSALAAEVAAERTAVLPKSATLDLPTAAELQTYLASFLKIDKPQDGDPGAITPPAGAPAASTPQTGTSKDGALQSGYFGQGSAIELKAYLAKRSIVLLLKALHSMAETAITGSAARTADAAAKAADDAATTADAAAKVADTAAKAAASAASADAAAKAADAAAKSPDAEAKAADAAKIAAEAGAEEDAPPQGYVEKDLEFAIRVALRRELAATRQSLRVFVDSIEYGPPTFIDTAVDTFLQAHPLEKSITSPDQTKAGAAAALGTAASKVADQMKTVAQTITNYRKQSKQFPPDQTSMAVLQRRADLLNGVSGALGDAQHQLNVAPTSGVEVNQEAATKLTSAADEIQSLIDQYNAQNALLTADQDKLQKDMNSWWTYFGSIFGSDAGLQDASKSGQVAMQIADTKSNIQTLTDTKQQLDQKAADTANSPASGGQSDKASSTSDATAVFRSNFHSRLDRVILLATYQFETQNLNDYVEPCYVPSDNPSEEGFFTPQLKPGCKANEFPCALAKVARDHVHVEDVQPSELADNISASTTKQEELALALALAGRLTEGIDISGAMQYVHESERRAQAVERHPLIVGFTDGARQFGWIFGPPFQVGTDAEASAQFVHQVAAYSVSASLQFPGWLDHMKLKGGYAWVDSQGKLQSPLYPLWPYQRPKHQKDPYQTDYVDAAKADDFQPEYLIRAATTKAPAQEEPIPQQEETYEGTIDDSSPLAVELPCDPSMATDALATGNVGESRMPFLENMPQTVMKGAVSQTIFLAGADVWRNPKVFLGGIEADAVEILPDMQSLSATFKNLSLPAGQYPLTLVTSVSHDRMENAVQVVDPAATPAAMSVSLAEMVAKPGGQLTFSYAAGTWPTNPTTVVAQLTPTGSAAINLPALSNEITPGKRTITLGSTVGTLAGPVACKLDLLVQGAGDSSPKSVMKGGAQPIAYLPNNTDQFIWTSTAAQTATSGVTLSVQLPCPSGVTMADFMNTFCVGFPQFTGFNSLQLELKTAVTGGTPTTKTLDLVPSQSNGITTPGIWNVSNATSTSLQLQPGAYTVSGDIIVKGQANSVPINGTFQLTVPPATPAPATGSTH